MTKAQVLDISGKKIKEITTTLFEEPIREDMIYKIVEAEKIKHPSAPKLYAGMMRSASGRIRHKRHAWKVSYGHGMSRIPRKIMWRRGTQFSWVGAIVPSVRGGRRAHPPKAITSIKKINKKEMNKALLSALTYSNTIAELQKKYTSLQNKEIKDVKFPIIVEDKILKLNTKEFFKALNNILKEFYPIAFQKKSKRAGIGKLRGRKYRKNAGALFIISKNENMKIRGIDTIRTKDLTVSDLADNGARLVIFSENAIKELENIGKKKSDKKEKLTKENKTKESKK
ncbi:MAG: 50S ribosomal protein L4 [Candidatus Pacearchaeota archaeon]|jgi:large subunit ribosomal protein L4e